MPDQMPYYGQKAEIVDSEGKPVEVTTVEVVPYSGQAVDLSKPVEAARALQEATAFGYELRAFQDRCRDALRAESDRRGQRTFVLEDGHKVEVASIEASVETTYDVQFLWDGLEAAGLPLERLAELVTYEPRVSGTLIRQIRKNPAYDRVIQAAVLSTAPKTRSVRVR